MTVQVMLNIVAFVFMFYLGISVAGSVRVGNALGAGKPLHARLASRLSIIVSACWSLVMASSLVLLRFRLPLVFTNDEAIIQ